MKPPAKAHGTDPMISRPASRRFGVPRRQWTLAPTDLLMLAATRSLATAAVGSTPRKISAGVISAPPPMPVRPTTMPTPNATTRTDEGGAGQELVHAGSSAWVWKGRTGIRSSRQSSMVRPVVSMWTAASVGSSYGLEMPVNSGISPARALA